MEVFSSASKEAYELFSSFCLGALATFTGTSTTAGIGAAVVGVTATVGIGAATTTAGASFTAGLGGMAIKRTAVLLVSQLFLLEQHEPGLAELTDATGAVFLIEEVDFSFDLVDGMVFLRQKRKK